MRRYKIRTLLRQLFRRQFCYQIILVGFLGVANSSFADSLTYANKLIRVTNASKSFEAIAEQQINLILRTYRGIVRKSTGADLPMDIRDLIRECYRSEYSWEKFERGFATILAQRLDENELKNLIDFHTAKSIPPAQIPVFKESIEKAGSIHADSIDYMILNSDNCIEKDAQWIRAYLRQVNASFE